MLITIANMYAGIAAIESLSGQKFQPATSLKIARIGSKLITERDLADKQRKTLLEETATLNKEGTEFKFTSPATKKLFEERWLEVCKTEITVHIDLLPIQALGKVEVTPADMQGLEPFLLIEEAALKPELVKKEEAA